MKSNNRKVAAIIQARMSSSRLPAKVLQDVCGRPLLERIVLRLKQCKSLDAVAVVTSTHDSDDLVADFCQAIDVSCFRGPLDDVLARYLAAIENLAVTHLVRITGDAPFVDADLIDNAVSVMLAENADMVRTTQKVVHEGIDPCSASLLRRIAAATAAPHYREHILAYAWDNPGFAKLVTFAPDPFAVRDNYHLSVDNVADLEFTRFVYQKFNAASGYFSVHQLLELLDSNPEIRAINQRVESNQGKLPDSRRIPQIAILLDGGDDRGFGHLVRMRQLARQLNARYNCSVVFLAPDNPLCRKFLDEFGLPVLYLPGYKGSIDFNDLFGAVESGLEFKVRLSPALKEKGLSEYYKITNAKIDALIVDRQFGIKPDTAAWLQAIFSKLVLIDYASENLERFCSLFILPNIHTNVEILETRWWREQPDKCRSGTEYVILRDAFTRPGLNSKNTGNHEQPFLLLSVGGTDLSGFLEPLIERLSEFWQGKIVVPGGAIAASRIQNIRQNPRVQVAFPATDWQLVELMDKAAVAVTLFGTICYELMARHKTMVVLPHSQRDKADTMRFCQRYEYAWFVSQVSEINEIILNQITQIKPRQPVTGNPYGDKTAKTIYELVIKSKE